MRFSEQFDIDRKGSDDWLDPVLTADTRLFVDPFRIYVDRTARWRSAHARLLDFFQMVLELVARSGGNRRSVHWRQASSLLLFPEPAEFCLGYAESSTKGRGSGRALQQGMLSGAETAVELSLDTLEHFEELALFEARIGADRISDIVCNVLKSYFIAYTQAVAKRHKISLSPMRLPHADWSREMRIWQEGRVELPRNPYSGDAVLLVPQRFIRDLPTVDPEEFWEWAWSNENEQIRGNFNYDLATNLDPEEIARFARMNPHIAARYLNWLEEHPKDAYDLEADPTGEASWYDLGALYAQQMPQPPKLNNTKDFCDLVRGILDAFKHNIEQEDGWIPLWYESRPRKERIVQAVFRSAVVHYCRAFDIDLSVEPNTGRGPVDFKFSQGWQARALVEVKLTNNSDYWGGLEKQTPQYMRSAQIDCGYFLSVGFRDLDFKKERMDLVREGADKVAKRDGVRLTPFFVDARPKKSASKL